MPYFREQGSGHIIQISCIGGLVTGPMSDNYSASKFALEGMSEALAQEAKHFGVKLTIVEPGGYWTNLYLKMQNSHPLAPYESLRDELARQFSEGSVDSDPSLAAEAILKIVNCDNPPLRLVLGSMLFDVAIDSTKERIATWKEWETVSRAAERDISAPEGYGKTD
ncbi:short chain dehydrogenase [Lentibacillus halodurans]|uniref:Short chain dehydrogenase n=1 Tax=Lentibacillus halodurans TaxID=237679 RepID=A0A1I0Y555_9BACI|nr:short chain dehydrogenase [Lentibacillus halodurans]